MTLFLVEPKEGYQIVHVNASKFGFEDLQDFQSLSQNLMKSNEVTSVILDLEKVVEISIDGMKEILKLQRWTESANTSFVLANAAEKVMDMIKLSRTEEAFNFLPTVSEAEDLIMMELIEKQLGFDDLDEI